MAQRGDRIRKRAEKINLTDRFLRSLRKKEHPQKPPLILFYDGACPGLNVLWTATGHLSFGMKKRWPGGSKYPTWRSLGAVHLPVEKDAGGDEEAEGGAASEDEITGGTLTLAEARAKARRWLDILARGRDPVGEERKRRIEAQKRTTFPVLRAAFLDHYKEKAKHGEATRILNKDFACWDDRFADEIDAGDVESAIQIILARGSKYQAINAFGYIRTMFSWAMGRPSLRIKGSPCAGLSTKTLIGKKRPRTRVLTDEELRSIWSACDHEECVFPYGRIVKLLLLTGVRENEIAKMAWLELNITERLLTVPSERMKGEEDYPSPPFEVPLTLRMIDIIQSMPRFSGPYVFTTTHGEKPVHGWSKAKARLDKLSGVSGWRFQDLRRTVRTRISAIPAEEHVREALVAHGRRGIQAHYDQHKYRNEKRHLLEVWEKKLLAIVSPPSPSVTDIDQERARRDIA